jgi:hypothetical protein
MPTRWKPDVSVHDRTPSPLGRKKTGSKSQRRGIPALIFGQAAATKVLAEIAALEPVAIEDLPERKNVTAQNIGYTVRRLVSVGLVRRYRAEDHGKHIVLMLNRELPWLAELRALLRVVRGKGAGWPARQAAALPEDRAVDEGPNVTQLEVFGRPAGDVLTVFGSLQRTIAIMVVTDMGRVDASTIARIVGVQTDRSMHQLLDPIEADGIFVSEMVGSIRLYALASKPWTKPLEAVVRSIVASRPDLANHLAPAETLMLTGDYSNRVHLRRELGYE